MLARAAWFIAGQTYRQCSVIGIPDGQAHAQSGAQEQTARVFLF